LLFRADWLLGQPHAQASLLPKLPLLTLRHVNPFHFPNLPSPFNHLGSPLFFFFDLTVAFMRLKERPRFFFFERGLLGKYFLLSVFFEVTLSGVLVSPFSLDRPVKPSYS